MRAEDHGPVIASQVHDSGFDDEATEFDKVPRALAALDLSRAHIMSRPCGLMPVAAPFGCATGPTVLRTVEANEKYIEDAHFIALPAHILGNQPRSDRSDKIAANFTDKNVCDRMQ